MANPLRSMLAMGFFRDGEGNPSSMRLGWFITLLVYLCTWVGFCIYNRQFINLGLGDAGALGALFGGKAAQAFAESNSRIGKMRELRKLKEFQGTGNGCNAPES